MKTISSEDFKARKNNNKVRQKNNKDRQKINKGHWSKNNWR